MEVTIAVRGGASVGALLDRASSVLATVVDSAVVTGDSYAIELSEPGIALYVQRDQTMLPCGRTEAMAVNTKESMIST